SFVTKDSPQEFLFRCWVSLSFRSDLSNQNITFLHLGTNSDQTVFIKICSGFFTNIRNVGSQLFQTPFGIPYFKGILIHVNGGKNIFPNYFLGNNDCILKVVTFPWHKGHFKVPSQCKLAIFGSITFTKYFSFLHLLTFPNN